MASRIEDGRLLGRRTRPSDEGWPMAEDRDRIELDEARVVKMRELTLRTSAVIDEVNQSGEPVLVSKHGRFVAMITPLAGHSIESLVLTSDPELRQVVAEALGDDDVDFSERS